MSSSCRPCSQAHPATRSRGTPSSSPSSSTSTLVLLVLVTLVTLTSLPTPASARSLLGSLKHLQQRQSVQCPNEEVSAICFQCASMDPTKFWKIHDPCCESEGNIRGLCRAWYSEEPKRGRRDIWYY